MTASCKRIQKIPPLPARPADAHKGSFGRVLVVGGSRSMLGAPALVGLSALRSGAGLATLAVPASVQPAIATLCPCATSLPLPETPTGQIDPVGARRRFKEVGLLDPAGGGAVPDAVVVGPGVGQGPAKYGHQLWELINAFRSAARPAMVLDADALNLAWRTTPGGPDGWDGQAHYRTVITPHPGELARMHGTTAGKIQADREGFAVRTARMMNANGSEPDYTAVVVLKGAGTVVTDGTCIYVNPTGNPGMATGGSGDVLAGMIGALLGQGLTCFHAAVAAVYFHGLAGDLAAGKLGQIPLIATDIIDALPEALAERNARRKREASKK